MVIVMVVVIVVVIEQRLMVEWGDGANRELEKNA